MSTLKDELVAKREAHRRCYEHKLTDVSTMTERYVTLAASAALV